MAKVKAYAVKRSERRVPLEVTVQIAGHPDAPAGVERTFTQDVSSRGARVRTTQRWQTNDRLLIASQPDFRATARVAYCQPVWGEGYAIGLEFLEPTGQWIIAPAQVQERTLNG